jgi:hypothetical protein
MPWRINGPNWQLETAAVGALAIETSADELDRIQHGQERDLAIGTLDGNSKLREVRATLRRIKPVSLSLSLEANSAVAHIIAITIDPSAVQRFGAFEDFTIE